MPDLPEIHDVLTGNFEPNDFAQVERERAMLAEGLAQLERGEFYDFDIVEAWLDALETDPNARLPPYSRSS